MDEKRKEMRDQLLESEMSSFFQSDSISRKELDKAKKNEKQKKRPKAFVDLLTEEAARVKCWVMEPDPHMRGLWTPACIGLGWSELRKPLQPSWHSLRPTE